MNEKNYIYFLKMKLHIFFTSQIFIFFVENCFLENFRRKSEGKSYQIENYFKKEENLIICVYYGDENYGVNFISVSFYK